MTFQSIAAPGYDYPWGSPNAVYEAKPKDLMTRAAWAKNSGLIPNTVAHRASNNAGGVEAPSPFILAKTKGRDLYSGEVLNAWWRKSSENIALMRAKQSS